MVGGEEWELVEGSTGEGGKLVMGDSGWEADLSCWFHECAMPAAAATVSRSTGISRWLRSITTASLIQRGHGE